MECIDIGFRGGSGVTPADSKQELMRKNTKQKSIKREILQSSGLLALAIITGFSILFSGVLYVSEMEKARVVLRHANQSANRRVISDHNRKTAIKGKIVRRRGDGRGSQGDVRAVGVLLKGYARNTTNPERFQVRLREKTDRRFSGAVTE